MARLIEPIARARRDTKIRAIYMEQFVETMLPAGDITERLATRFGLRRAQVYNITAGLPRRTTRGWAQRRAKYGKTGVGSVGAKEGCADR